jgi:hypothetical protein
MPSSASDEPGAMPSSTPISPVVWLISPTASCKSVVLPAPFGPIRATTRPAGMASVQSRSAQVRR